MYWHSYTAHHRQIVYFISFFYYYYLNQHHLLYTFGIHMYVLYIFNCRVCIKNLQIRCDWLMYTYGCTFYTVCRVCNDGSFTGHILM